MLQNLIRKRLPQNCLWSCAEKLIKPVSFFASFFYWKSFSNVSTNNRGVLHIFFSVSSAITPVFPKYETTKLSFFGLTLREDALTHYLFTFTTHNRKKSSNQKRKHFCRLPGSINFRIYYEPRCHFYCMRWKRVCVYRSRGIFHCRAA